MKYVDLIDIWSKNPWMIFNDTDYRKKYVVFIRGIEVDEDDVIITYVDTRDDDYDDAGQKYTYFANKDKNNTVFKPHDLTDEQHRNIKNFNSSLNINAGKLVKKRKSYKRKSYKI